MAEHANRRRDVEIYPREWAEEVLGKYIDRHPRASKIARDFKDYSINDLLHMICSKSRGWDEFKAEVRRREKSTTLPLPFDTEAKTYTINIPPELEIW